MSLIKKILKQKIKPSDKIFLSKILLSFAEAQIKKAQEIAAP